MGHKPLYLSSATTIMHDASTTLNSRIPNVRKHSDSRQIGIEKKICFMEQRTHMKIVHREYERMPANSANSMTHKSTRRNFFGFVE